MKLLMKRLLFLAAAAIMLSAPACASDEPPAGPDLPGAMVLTSTAFEEGEPIPARYSCDGEDVSPALAWSEVPEGTDSFALIMDDPDAPGGTFTHWVIFNIPRGDRNLPEGVPADSRLDNGALQGQTGFGRMGYDGPCPPSGPAHRYRFTLYALDGELSLSEGATKQQVLDAIEGHVLDQVTLTGTYQR
jgi:Raf kinase inhibitor-like YbhB/YbcL family protein